ncbi:MAG: hypothetical protein ABW032_10525 [Burkholderiaceae bacterium]
MSAMVLVLMSLLALAARTLYLGRRLAGWERLWRFTSGPLTIELHRHAGMSRFGSDLIEFPQPREYRTMSMRVAGIPIWSQHAIISLPAESDARIEKIAAGEFDQLFTRQFRMNWPKQAMRRSYLARH